MDEEIKKASVVLVVYDACSQDSQRRIDEVWLPRIIKQSETEPIVILVGNKIDKRSSLVDGELEAFIIPLIQKFK